MVLKKTHIVYCLSGKMLYINFGLAAILQLQVFISLIYWNIFTFWESLNQNQRFKKRIVDQDQ